MLGLILAWTRRFIITLVAGLKKTERKLKIMIRIRQFWVRIVGVGVLIILLGASCKHYKAVSANTSRNDDKLTWIEQQLSYVMTQLQIQSERINDLESSIESRSFNIKVDEEEPHNVHLIDPLTGLKYNVKEGSKAAEGLLRSKRRPLQMPLIKQLMPQILLDPSSIIPAYHMNENRKMVGIVMGIPSVKRDKESYLLLTLKHLVEEMSDQDKRNSVIVVFVGETDMQFVLNVATSIEKAFPNEVGVGFIEVLSPSQAYYPNMTVLKPTLGDSFKRARWRTKQNLDTIFLMAYAQSRGAFYLMLEDDIIAKSRFFQIKMFLSEVASATPKWEIISFSDIGGIGKLFKNENLFSFISYLQLFFTNMPIDWLIESYLSDKACGLDKTSKQCKALKAELYPHFNRTLFTHIGLFSSLKGKMHKVNVPKSKTKLYFPHVNPPATVSTDIESFSVYSLKMAYKGKNYFWGIRPKKGNHIDFMFRKPTELKSFFFRSASTEHTRDKLENTDVLALPAGDDASYISVGTFDEFGVAEGALGNDVGIGPLKAIRLLINKDITHWIIISEIELTLATSNSTTPSSDTYDETNEEKENRKK